MNILRNKYTIPALIVIFLLFLFFSSIKVTNLKSQNCESDSDCVFYEKNCCGSCGNPNSVNKNYLTILKINYFIRCSIKPCPWTYMCLKIAPKEPFCNQNKKCDIRTNCNETCSESWIKEIRFDNICKRREQVEEWLLKNTDCSCNLDEINFTNSKEYSMFCTN